MTERKGNMKTALKGVIALITSTAFMLSFAVATAAPALTSFCAGAPSTTSITWTASSTGGVAPIAFLWGNGGTSTSQTIALLPGTYSMTLQVADASSTVATTTCTATVAQLPPTISSLIANPSAITSGQNSVLSWVVGNASSTSLDNGIGAVVGASITVTPSVTTTYHLSAINPTGTTTASATVTVSATTTGADLAVQIQALLNQIAALKAQILQLLLQQQSGGTGTTATSTAPSCFNFNRNLSEGDDGDDVKGLQRELSSDPSIFPPGLITGFFGHRTEEALKKFQRKFGVFGAASTATGFFGPKTRELLREQCGDQDNDHDGISNSRDTDDDNDGIPDVDDPTPFVSDSLRASTSTSSNGEHENSNIPTSTFSKGRHGDSGEHDRRNNDERGGNSKENSHGD